MPRNAPPPQESEARDRVLGRHLWRMFRFAAPYKRRIALGLVSNAAARFFDLLPLVVAGRVVDAVNTGRITDTRPETFLWYGLAVLGTFLALALAQSVSDYSLDTMAQKVRHDIRTALYDHLQRLDVSFFEDRQAGDVMAVVSGDVDNLETFFSDVSTSVVRLVITFAGTYGFLLWLDWRLALLLFAPLPFAVLAVRFFATRVQPQYRRARAAVGAINAIIENNLQGIGVIQAYTAESTQAERVGRQSAEYRDAAIAASRERARFIPLIYATAGLAFGSLIAGGGWLTFSGLGPSLGDYTTFVLMALRLVLPLFVFGMLINQIQRSEASAVRILELLATPVRVKDAPDAEPLPEDEALRSLRFEEVRFSYPSRPAVINGLSLDLSRGRMVGVVGPTGAGKSTLVKLALRYYDPGAGRITINGRDLGSLTLASFRSRVGYVSQEAFLFYGTIAENIRLGAPEASDDEVHRAASIAGATEFIDRLEQGLETVVGERGIKLSGGQRQRISLARAVLRDPELLVLDEATSSVDTRTEELIQKNLLALRKGRMTLAVAHRLSTIRHADEILVVVDGLVVERGSHNELLAADGVYAGLWAVQSGEDPVR